MVLTLRSGQPAPMTPRCRLLLCLAATQQSLACSSPRGCSYNGVCAAGECQCDTPWSGRACEKLTWNPLDLSNAKPARGKRNRLNSTALRRAQTLFANRLGPQDEGEISSQQLHELHLKDPPKLSTIPPISAQPAVGGVEQHLDSRRGRPSHTKIIWAFWDQGFAQLESTAQGKYDFNSRCVKAWETLYAHHNSGWELRLLDDQEAQLLAPRYAEIRLSSNAARIAMGAGMSDLLRADLLSLYGGVWIDTSVCPFQMLEYWLPETLDAREGIFFPRAFDEVQYPSVLENFPAAAMTKSDLMQFVECYRSKGVYNSAPSRSMATWFIAVAKPHDPIVDMWATVLFEHLREVVDAQNCVLPRSISSYPCIYPYYIAHRSMSRARLLNEEVEERWQRIRKSAGEHGLPDPTGQQSQPCECMGYKSIVTGEFAQAHCYMVKQAQGQAYRQFIFSPKYGEYLLGLRTKAEADAKQNSVGDACSLAASSTMGKTIRTNAVRCGAVILRELIDIRAYYINVDPAGDRNQCFLQHYQGLKQPVTRIAAWTAPAPNLVLLPAQHGYRPRLTSSTELACSLSHLKAIAAAYRDGEELALILEDDALLSEQAFAMSNISGLRSLVASAPDDWNVLKLHTVNFRLQTKICNETTQAFVPFSWLRSANETAAKHWGQWGHWGTAAYVINRAGMEKALHATGYPNHKVWGLQEGHSNDKYTADEFIISPAVAGEVYHSPVPSSA